MAMFLVFIIFSLFFVLFAKNSYEVYVVFNLFYFFLLGKMNLASDFKRPVDLFNLFYFLFISTGSFVSFYIIGFNEDLAGFFAYFIVLFNVTAVFFVSNYFITCLPGFERTSNFSLFFCQFFLILSVLVAVLYYLKLGYIPLFSASTPEMRIAAMQGNGAYLQIMRFSVYVTIFLVLLYPEKKYFLLFIFFEFLLLGVGFRGMVAQNVVILLFSYGVLYNHRFGIGKVLLYGVLGLVFLSLLGSMRGDASFTDSFIVKIGHMISVSVYNFTMVYRHFDDFQYGQTFFYNFMMLAPGADIDYTQWLTTQIPINFKGGITPTIVGDMYVNFSHYLVITSPIIALALCKLQSNVFREGKISVIYTLIIINISVLIARSVTGGLSNQILNIVLSTIFLYIIFLLSKIKLIKR